MGYFVKKAAKINHAFLLHNCSVLISKMATMAAILAAWTFRTATIVLF